MTSASHLRKKRRAENGANFIEFKIKAYPDYDNILINFVSWKTDCYDMIL